MEMAPADQVKTTMRVLGLEEQLTLLESEAEREYNRRRDLGRDAERAEKTAEQLGSQTRQIEMPEDLPDLDALTTQLQEAQAHNNKITRIERDRDDAEREGKRLPKRSID